MADKSLLAAAVEARLKAYAPYSRFLVGAAVKDEHGIVHAGCNVENAAYPQGTCAEAGAIAAMVMGGGRRITEAAVVGAGGFPVGLDRGSHGYTINIGRSRGFRNPAVRDVRDHPRR